MTNLSDAFPWIDAERRRPLEFVSGEPGFVFQPRPDFAVVSSWLYVRRHLVERHGHEAWSDFLHAAASPCVVLQQTRPPRLALYRLRPGIANTFRVAIVEEQGGHEFLLITAFAKQSFAFDHYKALWHRVTATCEGYGLRRRDLHNHPWPVPPRWSPAALRPPEFCCELMPGCISASPGREHRGDA